MEYELRVPVAGCIYLTVEADSPEEAKEMAFTEDFNLIDLLMDGCGEIDIYSDLMKGNVSYVPCAHIEVTPV